MELRYNEIAVGEMGEDAQTVSLHLNPSNLQHTYHTACT